MDHSLATENQSGIRSEIVQHSPDRSFTCSRIFRQHRMIRVAGHQRTIYEEQLAVHLSGVLSREAAAR